ncbi:unnamed protein product [Lactuca saligna]|uniref:Uncharacterized protein n=1 Tax=Lactuca saligna TaxID=75948 RepID=A0AA35ZNJ4_LACSI|nr:unnamed protein product [Lactuca saligna]
MVVDFIHSTTHVRSRTYEDLNPITNFSSEIPNSHSFILFFAIYVPRCNVNRKTNIGSGTYRIGNGGSSWRRQLWSGARLEEGRRWEKNEAMVSSVVKKNQIQWRIRFKRRGCRIHHLLTDADLKKFLGNNTFLHLTKIESNGGRLTAPPSDHSSPSPLSTCASDCLLFSIHHLIFRWCLLKLICLGRRIGNVYQLKWGGGSEI